MIPPAFNPLEKEGRHAMHIRKIVTLWTWTINGSGEKLQMPIGNDSGIHQNVTEGISSRRSRLCRGGRAASSAPVELLFQHVKDIIVDLVGAREREEPQICLTQSAAFSPLPLNLPFMPLYKAHAQYIYRYYKYAYK
jgi:hypothetical protein